MSCGVGGGARRRSRSEPAGRAGRWWSAAAEPLRTGRPRGGGDELRGRWERPAEWAGPFTHTHAGQCDARARRGTARRHAPPNSATPVEDYGRSGHNSSARTIIPHFKESAEESAGERWPACITCGDAPAR